MVSQKSGGPTAVFVFVVLLVIYRWDSSFLFYSDTEVNAFGAVSVIERNDLLLSHDLVPWTLEWEVVGPLGTEPVEIREFGDFASRLYAAGILRTPAPTYLVRESEFPDRYVNTFGFGVSLSAVPVMAMWKPSLSDPRERFAALWYSSKLAACCFVAGSGAMVYLCAARFTTGALAVLLAFAYGLGTSVWSISSQSLWQHAPSELFLSLGTYGLIRSRDGWKYVALSGAAFAWATWCRHPSAVAVIAAGGYFLLVDRRSLAVYISAGLPFAAGMFGLNAWCYGSPFHFGELLVPHLATETTGQASIWQTPVWVGLSGMLLSPSRGMFVYSPFLVFGLWGSWVAWRDARLEMLRPLTITVAGLWLVHAVYFDWWGGFSYGYRQIVDSTVFLVVLMAPILSVVLSNARLRVVFVTLLSWSILVQAVGAWSFDIHGWNNRPAVAVRDSSGERIVRLLEFSEGLNWIGKEGSGEYLVWLSIDSPENRKRLWSLRDNQILYYMTHFWAARTLRQKANAHVCRPVGLRWEETLESLATALERVGRTREAEEARMERKHQVDLDSE